MLPLYGPAKLYTYIFISVVIYNLDLGTLAKHAYFSIRLSPL